MQLTVRHAQRIGRVLALVAAAGTAQAGSAPDWKALADVDTVVVRTTDADGSPRETTIWLAVHEGRGYIRTGGTRWGGNLERSPELVLIAEGTEHPMRVAFVEDPKLRDAVVDVFREKYGWSDAVIGVFRGLGGPPRIMRLEPETAAATTGGGLN